MSLTENLFVHLIRMPDETDVCFTGKENVKPSSLLLTGENSEFCASLSTNCLSDEAIKSKRSCKQKKHHFLNYPNMARFWRQRRTCELQNRQPRLCWSLNLVEWVGVLHHMKELRTFYLLAESARPWNLYLQDLVHNTSLSHSWRKIHNQLHSMMHTQTK